MRAFQRTIRARFEPRPIPIGRVERWLGVEKVGQLQNHMRGWYGAPINIVDMPGSVWIDRHGEFVGKFHGGAFVGALDAFSDMVKAGMRHGWQPSYGTCNAGFTSISDALARASQGYSQRRSFAKTGQTGVTGGASSTWVSGTQPVSGNAGAAAPGGTAHVDSDTGGILINNPSSGTMRLVGCDASSSAGSNCLMMYDRLFSVAKTASSSATEAVTGDPTRYQSTTATAEDYIGDNFLFVEAHSALGGGAHNWTVCTYTDQGAAASTLPSITAISSPIIGRLDLPLQSWFAPLEAGDVGIQTLTQMQNSSAVITGTANFCIGHVLGFMAMPLANFVFPYDWLTNRDQAPCVFNDACIAFLEMPKPSTTASTYTGRFTLTTAA